MTGDEPAQQCSNQNEYKLIASYSWSIPQRAYSLHERLQHRVSRNPRDSEAAAPSHRSIAFHRGSIRKERFQRYKSHNPLLAEWLKNDRHSSIAVGSLYVICNPLDPGYFKVGYTEETVSKRVRQIGKKCHYAPECNLKWQWHHIQFPKIVEEMVHLILNRYRRQEVSCNDGFGCRSKHDEWFEANIKVILSTVTKCVKWIANGKPFTKDGKLKPEWHRRLNRLPAREYNKLSVDKLLRM